MLIIFKAVWLGHPFTVSFHLQSYPSLIEDFDEVISRMSTFSFSYSRFTMVGEVYRLQKSKTWQTRANHQNSFAKQLSCRPRRQNHPGLWACSPAGRT